MMPSKLDAAAALESMDSMDALQSKPLTTVPDEMRPAFDYSGLDAQTVDDLHFAEKEYQHGKKLAERGLCLLYTSPSPRDRSLSRMPSSA